MSSNEKMQYKYLYFESYKNHAKRLYLNRLFCELQNCQYLKEYPQYKQLAFAVDMLLHEKIQCRTIFYVPTLSLFHCGYKRLDH